MDIEKIQSPDITGRKVISRRDINPGDVVAFATEYAGRLRTGLMVTSNDEKDWFIWAVNLYKEDGRVWTEDEIPSEDIIFFEPTEEEMKYGLVNAVSIEVNTLVDSKDSAYYQDYVNSVQSMLQKLLDLFN